MSSRNSLLGLAAAGLLTVGLPAFAQALQPPPAAPVRAVNDTYWGVTVSDPYRYLEEVKNPEVDAWMRAQNAHTRALLDSIPGRAPMLARVKEVEDAVAGRVVAVQRLKNDLWFYEKRGPQDSQYKLYLQRGLRGKERLLVDPERIGKEKGVPHAINYYAPTDDGRHVAYGISAAGSEEASIHVIDTRTLRPVTAPIDRAQFPQVSWLEDGSGFFYMRHQEMKPGMDKTEKYRNGRVYFRRIRGPAAADPMLLGPGSNPRVRVAPEDSPYIIPQPGGRYAIALVEHGVDRELTIHAAPLKSALRPDAPWIKVADVEDKVTGFAVRGDDIYLLTYKDAPRFKIVRTRLDKPDLASASTVIPAGKQVVVGMGAARDALYVQLRDGASQRLLRVPHGGATEEVELPYPGAVEVSASDPRLPGALLQLMGWTRNFQYYLYDPVRRRLARTTLQPVGKFDAPDDLAATEVMVRSHDGVEVPMSIIHRKGMKLDGSNPAILYGYGAYGIPDDPFFVPRLRAWFDQGGIWAVAHVRGGGAFGREWHEAGRKATKPNTWKDAIACAEWLVAHGYTSRARLGIFGGSAGGILVGRAITERPDLFAVGIPSVGVFDTVRMETTPNGVPNVPEFGTVKKEDEFRALFAMSSYDAVRAGTAYPAVLLPHGVNDPRVDVWESLKMAARLQAASTSGKPVLLRLDFDAGHGVGSTKQQRQNEWVDMFAFLLWQFGAQEFQPAAR
jgi:prolyl oligopeptidase